jgi:UDP-glucose 4-epimerase
MMQKTIIITGAHGFLGRHIARRAAQAGYTVYGLGHGAWLQEEWTLWGLTGWHRSGVTCEALLELAVEPEAIIHCAGSGSVPFSLANPWEDLQRTVSTTASVLEFIRKKAPLSRLVYPSSAGVYGAVKEVPIREEISPAPISPYGAHKLMAENLIASYARNFGVKAATIRYFSIFGTGLRKQFLWDACGKLSRNEVTFSGTGQEVRDWLYVEDAASLAMTALDHASADCPIVNGGTGQGTSVAELLHHLAQCLGQPDIKPAFSNVLRAGDPARYIADVTKALSWGWKPEKHLAERVAEYVDWWLREMGLPKAKGDIVASKTAETKSRSIG